LLIISGEEIEDAPGETAEEIEAGTFIYILLIAVNRCIVI